MYDPARSRSMIWCSLRVGQASTTFDFHVLHSLRGKIHISGNDERRGCSGVCWPIKGSGSAMIGVPKGGLMRGWHI